MSMIRRRPPEPDSTMWLIEPIIGSVAEARRNFMRQFGDLVALGRNPIFDFVGNYVTIKAKFGRVHQVEIEMNVRSLVGSYTIDRTDLGVLIESNLELNLYDPETCKAFVQKLVDLAEDDTQPEVRST